MGFRHGNVESRPAQPHPAYDRYIAVLDVLGMKEWLRVDTAQSIAERLDVALAACDQACSGAVDGGAYGPLLGNTHFSDTLLIWSPDDSWASLAVICSSVKLIVATALEYGVPLRGAISLGSAVCSPRTMRFVGQPIADAFLWSDKERKYRSVGVDITPRTLDKLKGKLERQSLPRCWDCWLHGTPVDVLKGDAECSHDLIWYEDGLYLNHSAHGIFTGGDPEAMFEQRGLDLDESARAKRDAMVHFFATARAATRRSLAGSFDRVADGKRILEQLAEYLKLDAVRLARST